MFLLEWYRQWLEIRYEFKQKKFELTSDVKKEEVICQSCETLKLQLETVNYEKQRLLDRLLHIPEKEPEVKPSDNPQRIPTTRFMPWKVRQQILEREDREKANAMRRAAKPSNEKIEIEELEKEMDIAGQTRENQVS